MSRMSQVMFDKLFAGYPESDKTDRLRDAVRIAIRDDLATLPLVYDELPSATCYASLAFVAAHRGIECMEVWNVEGLPARAESELGVLRQPYQVAASRYHGVVTEWQGPGRQPTEEFVAYRDVMYGVVGDLISWLKELQP